MKKFSSKILLFIILCCIFISFLIGGFSLYLGSNLIKKEASNKLTYMARSYANEFSQSLEKTESYVDSLLSIISGSFNMDEFKNNPYYIEGYEKKLDDTIEYFVSNNNNAFGLYVTFNPYYTNNKFIEIWYEDITKKGTLYRMNDDTARSFPDIFSDEWTYPCVNSLDPNEPGMKFLYDTLAAGKPLWFKPYREIGLENTTLSHVTVISYVVPIIIDDAILGVVGMDTNFDYIQKSIKEMDVYQNGYAFLLDESNDIIIYPDDITRPNEQSLERNNISYIINQSSDKPFGTIEYEDKGKIIGYSKLSNGWALVLVAPRSEVFQPIWLLSVFMFFLTFSCIIITIFIAYRFSKRVSKTMDTVTNQLRYIEIGDFTREIPEVLLKTNDDLGHFIKSVYTMQNIIKDLMKELEYKTTDSIESTLINNAVEKTQGAATEAALAIEQLSIERFEKDENLKETLKKLEELNSKLQAMVNAEVQKNRQKDAVMIYQSRHAKMGEMIGNIAHQWRQPLNSLGIMLAELKDAFEYDDLNEKHLQSVIEKSNQIISNMSQTINDFRDFLSPSKQKTPFSIYNAVSFSVDLIEQSIHSNSISLEMNLISDAFVYGYKNEFSQVISNILNNAKDALEEANSNNRVIRIKITKVDSIVVISIFNSGQPISSEVMSKIFTPYFTTKTLGQGTGIGLYMSKIIIEEHMNGTITFENVKNGVLCCIKLPVYDERYA